MFKSLFLPLIGVGLFIAAVGVLFKNAPQGILNLPSSSAPAQTSKVKIDGTEIKVTLADTAEKRSRGLSGAPSLKENEGMLFVFDAKDTEPAFWMKDMLFDLDIIWINDGEVVKIDKSVLAPPNETSTSNLILYRPGMPIDYVLEVVSGFSDKYGIKVGSRVIL